MKTLVLILALVAQDLRDADGTTWKRVATGKPRGGRQWGLYVQTPTRGTRNCPEVRTKKDDSPIRTVYLDCKAGMLRTEDEGWVRPPKGTVGAHLLKFVCK